MMASLQLRKLLNLGKSQAFSLHAKRYMCCSSIRRKDQFDHSALSYTSSNHAQLHEYSVNNPDEFWGPLGRSKLQWMEDFHTVSSSDLNVGKHEWFLGGKINASVNCLDRHAEQNPDGVALIWERDEPGTQVEITYKEEAFPMDFGCNWCGKKCCN